MADFNRAYRKLYFSVPVMGLAADFQPAYSLVKVAEGGYVNNPADRGGETYAGIARKYWPNSDIWAVVDFYKNTKYPNGIPVNTKLPGTDGIVEEFYRDLWNSGNFGAINNQALANLAFDTRILHGSTGVKMIQQIVGSSADGVMGPKTVAAMNAYPNVADLQNKIVAARKNLIQQIVTADASQAQFYAGWLKRINQFAVENPTISILGGISIIATLLTLAHMANRQSNRKRK